MDRQCALDIFSKGFLKFLDRNDLTLDQVGKLLGCGRANIHKIKTGKNFPSVEGIFTLVENGMRIEEIFGSDLAEKLLDGLKPDPKIPDKFDDPEFKKGVQAAVAEMFANGFNASK